MSRIVDKVAQINSVVANIAAGTEEQSTALQQVNSAINQMDQATQQNAAMAEQASAASRSMTSEIRNLSDAVGSFKVGGNPARGSQRIEVENAGASNFSRTAKVDDSNSANPNASLRNRRAA